jgi:bifunctional DNA-binding transcriptional regulator/antitoxin component of YhaV-PrlF toxin-antitoxin module
LSEETELVVGKRGEIYTTRELRDSIGLEPGGRVIAKVMDDKIVIQPKPSPLSLLLKKRIGKPVDLKEFNKERRRLSEEIQLVIILHFLTVF